MTRPLGSTSTASSRSFTATTSRSASAIRVGTPSLAVSPAWEPPSRRHRRQYRKAPSHVPCKSRRSGSRRLHAGRHLAGKTGHPPGSSRDYPLAPVLMPTNLFRHVNGYNARLPDPRLTRVPGLFPHRSPRQSSANAAVGGLKPPPVGRLRRADNPSSPAQHRLQKLPIKLLSTFVTHTDSGLSGSHCHRA